MGSQPVPDQSPSKREDALLELFKRKQDQAAVFMNHTATATSVFLLINGGLAKFAFDSSSTPTLKTALCAMGITAGAVGVLACGFGELVRRRIRRDLDELFAYWQLPVAHDDLGQQMYVVICAALVFALVTIGWIYFVQLP